MDRDLFWLEKARLPFSNPYWYLDDLDPDMYLHRNYASLNVRMKAFIKYARGIPKMVTDIQANLQGPLPKTYVELGIADFGGFADFFTKDVAAIFAAVTDADLQKQLADADKNAATAMNNSENLFDRPAQDCDRQICLGQGFVRRDGQRHRGCRPAGRGYRGRGPRRPGAQYAGPQGGVRSVFAEGLVARLHRKGVGRQAARRPARCGPRAVDGYSKSSCKTTMS